MQDRTFLNRHEKCLTEADSEDKTCLNFPLQTRIIYSFRYIKAFAEESRIDFRRISRNFQ